MAMELENIVANTVYIKAREGDRGRSKKWKEMLRLPPVAQCLCLRDEIEHTYEYLVEEQPIGAELFKQFCQKDVQLSKCVEFVQELDNFKLVAEEKCAAMAQKVFDNFISLECPSRVDPISEELAVEVQARLEPSVGRDIFRECRL